jgi:hypothetical protein
VARPSPTGIRTVEANKWRLVCEQLIICASVDLDQHTNPVFEPGLMMDILMLSLKLAKIAHKNGELCTENKYDTDLTPNVFDLRVTLRFIQTRRDGTEIVERTIASSFWRAAATLVARKHLKRNI